MAVESEMYRGKVLVVCAAISLLGCQGEGDQLTEADVEQIATDALESSDLHSEVSRLQVRLDEVEGRLAEAERERSTMAAQRTESDVKRYRLVGGRESSDYATQSRCLAAKEIIESDYRERQAAAGTAIIFSPPKLSCIPVG